MDGNPVDDLEASDNRPLGNDEEGRVEEETQGKPKRTRVVSAIDFPYVDLDQSILVPDAIHNKMGSRAAPDQLSGALDLKGGAFHRRMSGARMFGLVEKDGENYRITDLGRRIVNPEQSPAARVEAFLNVALYKRIYDDFRGGTLPGDEGLEGHMKDVGVPAKQAENARQVFRRSARQAGFFPFGEDRLIIPILKEGSNPPPPPANGGKEKDPSDSEGGGEDGGNGGGGKEVEALRREVDSQRRTIEELTKQVNSKSAPVTVVSDLPPAVVGILTTLPLTSDDKWSDEDLTEWITVFRGVVRRSFKDRIAPPKPKHNE